MYDIELYKTKDGTKPFSKWLKSLKDARARARIRARLDRVSLGNFGDHKPLTNAQGISELRDPYGAGLRVYYYVVINKKVLLLTGSIKANQKKAIRQSKEYLTDYLERKDNETE